MTMPFDRYDIQGFMGMVSYAGSERLKSGTLKETQNVYNKVPGDLAPRPGLIDSTNFTGVANAPITLFFYQRSPNFAPQGGSGSGAQSNTQGFSVSGTNTNPGYTSGTQSGGLGGGSGAGGIRKHHHTADTNAEGGYLHLSTKVSNDGETIIGNVSDVFKVNSYGSDILALLNTAKVDNGTTQGNLSEVVNIGTDSGSNGALRISEVAKMRFNSGATDEPASYGKLVHPPMIGKVKTSDIAVSGTGTLKEVDLAGVQMSTVEHTGVKNLTGSIMGVDSYYVFNYDWKGNLYAHTQVHI